MTNKFDPDGTVDPVEVRSRTDVMFQEFSLYIEGVQVPFMNMNIRSQLGYPPEANIQVPSQAGLMEITRYYEPKVHIFYKDVNTGKNCVFFTGIITSSNYMKSSSTPPRKFISFNCRHKYSQLDMVTLDYSGYANDSNSSVTNQNQNQSAIKPNSFNSAQSIGMALAGIDPNKIGGTSEINLKNIRALGPNGAPMYDSIPESMRGVSKRMVGFPGVALNLWNQLKAQSYQDSAYYEGMTRMFIPLVEQGLQLFQRMGGHYYVEEKLNASKQDPCGKDGDGTNALQTEPRLIPPCHKSFMISAVQADISTQIIASLGSFSGEMTSFMQVLQNLMYSIEYDIVFLNAPAEVPMDPTNTDPESPTQAMDVIIKPQMPHYYAPACNVVLPYMYDSISVNQEESSIPTRITAVSDIVPGSTGQFGVNFRAPQSVREAVARGVTELEGASSYSTLARTTAGAHYKIGKYEQGRGIRHQRVQLPSWLALLSESLAQQPSGDSETRPATDSPAGIDIEKFRRAWQYRYDPKNEKKQLNPWDQASDLNSYMRLLFSAADYKFTTEVAKARTGSVNMIFNPYIIPGYPMDIIDPTPTEPSFHAFCIGVSHSISARGVSTSAEFVSAMTYAELGNYEQQYINPWMQSTLKTLNEVAVEFPTTAARQQAEKNGDPLMEYKSSIVNNSEAREAANEFYMSALGVGAAIPEMLYDFSNGRPYPFFRKNGKETATNSGLSYEHVSGEGNLQLVYRPIETKELIEERFGIKFIDLAPDNYDPIVFSYKEPILTESKLMEPGQSLFLNYTDLPAESQDEIDAKAGT